jgi:hypothetical protein
MARSLRSCAGAGVLVLCSICAPASAQQRDGDQVTVPFSSLSASAQAEILALQGFDSRSSAANPLIFPVDEPATQSVRAPLSTETVMLDGRKVRINWAIGMYR